jgi:hypothetical protein
LRMSRLATPPAFDVGSESLLNGFIYGPLRSLE